MRPRTGGQFFCEHTGLFSGQTTGQELAGGLLDLRDGLAANIGQYQCVIVDFRHGLFLDDLDERGRRRFSELRIDRTQRGMLAHDDFIGRERDQRAA